MKTLEELINGYLNQGTNFEEKDTEGLNISDDKLQKIIEEPILSLLPELDLAKYLEEKHIQVQVNEQKSLTFFQLLILLADTDNLTPIITAYLNIEKNHATPVTPSRIFSDLLEQTPDTDSEEKDKATEENPCFTGLELMLNHHAKNPSKIPDKFKHKKALLRLFREKKSELFIRSLPHLIERHTPLIEEMSQEAVLSRMTVKTVYISIYESAAIKACQAGSLVLIKDFLDSPYIAMREQNRGGSTSIIKSIASTALKVILKEGWNKQATENNKKEILKLLLERNKETFLDQLPALIEKDSHLMTQVLNEAHVDFSAYSREIPPQPQQHLPTTQTALTSMTQLIDSIPQLNSASPYKNEIWKENSLHTWMQWFSILYAALPQKGTILNTQEKKLKYPGFNQLKRQEKETALQNLFEEYIQNHTNNFIQLVQQNPDLCHFNLLRKALKNTFSNLPAEQQQAVWATINTDAHPLKNCVGNGPRFTTYLEKTDKGWKRTTSTFFTIAHTQAKQQCTTRFAFFKVYDSTKSESTQTQSKETQSAQLNI